MKNADDVRPFFIPDKLDYEAVPESLSAAIEGLVEPLHKSYVLEVDDPLERSFGNSLVTCQMMEILDQIQLGDAIVGDTKSEQALTRQAQLLHRLHRDFSIKCKLSDALIRCRSSQRQMLAGDPLINHEQFGIPSLFDNVPERRANPIEAAHNEVVGDKDVGDERQP